MMRGLSWRAGHGAARGGLGGGEGVALRGAFWRRGPRAVID